MKIPAFWEAPCLLIFVISFIHCKASTIAANVAMDAPPARSEAAWWHIPLPLLACALPSLSPSSQTISALAKLLAAAAMMAVCTIMIYWAAPGGHAWGRLKKASTIRGPRGWPVLGSLLEMGGLTPHIRLAQLASQCSAKGLMAFSLGNTRAILTCVPEVAREILNSSSFADRPIKQSARQLLFHRAIGFAPYGCYWRCLRRIAANHLFAPKRIAAHEASRQHQASLVLDAISEAMSQHGAVRPRSLLQQASVNNIMSCVFGKTYAFKSNGSTVSGDGEAEKLHAMIREGFELLGAFNWGDHLPWFCNFFDTSRIAQRCESLVGAVRGFVQKIIDEHRQVPLENRRNDDGSGADFVDVLLSLEDSEKLADEDMIAVLWEMIFRGTDTTAILMEWILAEMVLHPEAQRRVQEEVDRLVEQTGSISEGDLGRLPYLLAVIKETLRMHPPGPLLSWARLSTTDVLVAGHEVPAGTTAMVNMWAITHDPSIWPEPEKFFPERFLASSGGAEVDIRGSDLRLAPFGAGRRVCPGRALGQTVVQLWTARLLYQFNWSLHGSRPVDLSEELKLSSQMRTPLVACATLRRH